jgi:hypothetical protein
MEMRVTTSEGFEVGMHIPVGGERVMSGQLARWTDLQRWDGGRRS